MARTWCHKGSCSGEASDFTMAAASFKCAQRLAEDAGDMPLVLCAMVNRAICEVRRGDAKAAATRSRRAFVKAEAEKNSEMMIAAHCARFERLLVLQSAGCSFWNACIINQRRSTGVSTDILTLLTLRELYNTINSTCVVRRQCLLLSLTTESLCTPCVLKYSIVLSFLLCKMSPLLSVHVCLSRCASCSHPRKLQN